MRKSLLTAVMLGALCMACASKRPPSKTRPCSTDPAFEHVTVTISYNGDTVTNITPDRQEVTIYLNPKPEVPSQKGQVCWILAPTDGRAPLGKLKKDFFLESKDGSAQFGHWRIKKKMPGDPLEIRSGLPNYANPDWQYSLASDGVELDPKIIIIGTIN